MPGSKLIGHLAAAGAYIIFGLNIVFCKDIANASAISPIALFSLRALFASALFWLVSIFCPKEQLAKGDFWRIGLASFIGLFVPQYTFLVAISFGGILFLIFNSVLSSNGVTQTRTLGIILLLMNSLSFAAYLGIFKPMISRYNVITFMKWMFPWALAISLPFSFRDLVTTNYAAIPANVVWEIGFLVFFATFIAYFLVPVGQKRIRPTLVSMYSYLQPIIAAVFAIIAGMDLITWQKILATVLVVSGVIIVNKSRAASA